MPQPPEHLSGLIWALSYRSPSFLWWGNRAGHNRRQKTTEKKRWGWLNGPFQSLSHGGDKDFPTPIYPSISFCIFHIRYEKPLWAAIRIWALTLEHPIWAHHFRDSLFPEGENGLLVDEKSMMDQIPSGPAGSHSRAGQRLASTKRGAQKRMWGHHSQDITSHSYHSAELQ